MRTSILVLLLATTASGCLGTGYVRARSSASYTVETTPTTYTVETRPVGVVEAFTVETAPVELQQVSSDVWVVYDYSQPVFYSAGGYWWWSGSGWYRSRYADGGWAHVELSMVPAAIRSIDRPHRYVRYRGPSERRAVPRADVSRTYPRRPAAPVVVPPPVVVPTVPVVVPTVPRDRYDRDRDDRVDERRDDRRRRDRDRDDRDGRGPRGRGDRDRDDRFDEDRDRDDRSDEGRGRDRDDRRGRGRGRGPR
jgi:hypothetical protein